MKGAWILYSDAELLWIRGHRDWPRKQAHAAFVARWGWDDVSFANFKALCTRRGWATGRTGCFEKGQTPPNKGRKGYCAPGSEKGWFKPGNRTGRANQNHKPVGTERVSKDGYLERKVHEGLPLQSRWRAIHLIRWEAVHGPVPDGHALKCLDGNRQNTDPVNWQLIDRALLPRLNNRWGRNYDAAPDEVKPTIMLMARVEAAASQHTKRKKRRKYKATHA